MSEHNIGTPSKKLLRFLQSLASCEIFLISIYRRQVQTEIVDNNHN